MRRKTIVARLRKLGLAFLACLVFAVLAPMYFAERRTDEGFTISSVFASPRDLHVLTVPVRLSDAPDLTLTRSVVYEYGPPAAGGTMANILLDGPVFTLNAAGPAASSGSGGPGRADLDPQGPLSPLIRQIAALGFELVAIRGGTLHVTMADGTVETIRDIQAELSQPRKGQIACKGSFTARGQRLAFNAALEQPPDEKSPARWPLQASFKGALIHGRFEGHADVAVDLQLVGQVELAISSLRRIGGWFNLPLNVTGGFNAATVKAELTWARRSLAFEKAHIAVDGNEADGRLVLNLGGARPLIDATLDFSRLDLTPYLEAGRSQLFGFDLPGAAWSSFDISLPMIRHLDADLRVSARQVRLAGYTFGQGAATIAAHGGKLQADITELDLNAGTLSAQIAATMSEPVPRYALRAKVENLDAGPATRLLLGMSALTGRATLTADLTGSGYSLRQIVRRLSGKMALAMPEGARVALDIQALRAAAKAGRRGWTALGKTHTSIEQLEVRAVIIGGVAFAEATHARAGGLALAASGRFGLDDGNMDVRLTLKPKASANQPGARAAMSGGETVTLRGPWKAPVVHAETLEFGPPK